MVLDLGSHAATVGGGSGVTTGASSLCLVVDTVSWNLLCRHHLEHVHATTSCRLLGSLIAWSMCVHQENQKEIE